MAIVRVDPFALFRDFESAFEPAPVGETAWHPRVDVLDEDEALLVRAEVPGVDPESIDVTVEDGVLTVSGSRSFETEETKGGFRRKEIFEGSFRRSVRLPKSADADAITATSKDGILEIAVPKKAEVLPRKVTVDVQR